MPRPTAKPRGGLWTQGSKLARWTAAVGFVVPCAVAGACQVSHGRVAAPRLARAPVEVEPLDPHAAAATMARLCGTTYDTPMGVHALDDEEFLERFHAHDPARRFDGVPRAFWAAFHFVPDARSVVPAGRTALDRGVLGFYDPTTDELFVRRQRQPDEQRFVLAHEVAHGVQRRLGVLLPWHVRTADEDLARRALVEGDANLMAAAYLMMERKHAVGVAVARIRDRVANMSTADVVTMAQLPPSLLRAVPVLRMLLLFPYIEGTAFATALYQSGGVALVDSALAHPPTSTEQLLHPRKYIEGELPVPVSPPVARGTVVARGTLGELLTAAYLAECQDEWRARQAAEGWGGDAYTVAIDEKGRLAVLWATAWDTPDAAARFESALRGRVGCAAGGAPRTLRRDEKVAVVDAPPDSPYNLEDLLANVQPALPRAPPVGPVVLRSLLAPEPMFLHQGQITHGLFASEQLGVEVTIPQGMRADVPTEGPELTLRTTTRLAALQFAFESIDTSEEHELADKIASRLLPKGKGAVQEAYEIRLPMGMADVEQVRMSTGELLLAAFVPVCQGEATLILVSTVSRAFDWTTNSIDDWFDGVRVKDDSPACAYLRKLANPAGGAVPP